MQTTTWLGWMAWTWQTAVFFCVIALLLVAMAVWEWRAPGGGPRRGVLRLNTTRGDRLFISLLAAGYLHMLWLALVPLPLWGASVAAVALALLIFRLV